MLHRLFSWFQLERFQKHYKEDLMEHFKSHQEYFTKFASNTSMKKQEEEHYKEHFKEQCMDNLK